MSRGASARVDALDGLRAVAVVVVMAVHAFPGSAFPGAVGVDVFFVLSGFLITTLLLGERARTGRVALGRFWARRALRLAPPLLVLLVVLYPLGQALVGDAYVGRALLVAQFRSNLLLTVEHVSVSPLEHTWSLGQEAQFYLLWPVVLLLLLALRVPRSALAVACVAGAVWCAHRLWVVEHAGLRPSDDFRPDVRGGGLLLGCALALVAAQAPRVLGRTGTAEAGLVGLLGLCAWSVLVDPVPLEVAVPVAVVCATAAVAGLLGTSGPAVRLLGAAGPRFLGRISYSLYLWHYPFFDAVEKRTDLPLGVLVLVETTLSVAAAAVSYTVVEQPVARWSARHLAQPGTAPRARATTASAGPGRPSR